MLYYGPLFLVIAIISAIVSWSPQVPAWFGSLFGAILAICAGIWFIPLGLIAMLTCTKGADAKHD